MKSNVIIIILFALSYTAAAQGQAGDGMLHKNHRYVRYKLMTNPVELMVQNINLSAERVFEQYSLGATLAFKPAIQTKGEIQTFLSLGGQDYYYANALNHVYNAASAGMNSKRYFHPRRRKIIYMDLRLQYRYWWFDNKDVSYSNVEGYRFNATRTEHVNVYDGKILFGCSLAGGKSSSTKMVVDFFGGIDLRYKAWQYQTYDGTVNDIYHTYLKETGSSWLGGPCIGLQLGVGR